MPNTLKFTEAEQIALYRLARTDELVDWYHERLSLVRSTGTETQQFNERMLTAIAAELTRRGFVLEIVEAHEQAHRENEHRWAAEQVAHIAADDGEIIADLLARVRRNWRLSREFPQAKRYAAWSGMASTELEREYGAEVAFVDGTWIVDFEAGWTESGSDA